MRHARLKLCDDYEESWNDFEIWKLHDDPRSDYEIIILLNWLIFLYIIIITFSKFFFIRVRNQRAFESSFFLKLRHLYRRAKETCALDSLLSVKTFSHIFFRNSSPLSSFVSFDSSFSHTFLLFFCFLLESVWIARKRHGKK